MSSAERGPRPTEVPVGIDQYFTLFNTPKLARKLSSVDSFQRVGPLEFKSRVVLNMGEFTIPFSILADWIWNNKALLPNLYPAFTPYNPKRGFTLDETTDIVKKRDDMIDKANKWAEGGMCMESGPAVYDTLCQDSYRLAIIGVRSTRDGLTEDQLQLLKRLRFRVEFGKGDERDKVMGSSYDSIGRMNVKPEGSQEPRAAGFSFIDFSPSEVPFHLLNAGIVGLPIRLANPVFSQNVEWLKEMRGKFFLAGEGLLAEYQAVTNPREFKPNQDNES